MRCLTDVVSYVHQLKLTNDEQTVVIDQLNKTNINQVKLITDQAAQLSFLKSEFNQTRSDLKMDISKLQTSVTDTEHRLNTHIIFTAILDHHTEFSDNEVVVFNNLKTSLGGGYNSSTGIFTSPVSGYFMFEMHVMGQYDKSCSFSIFHNNNRVCTAYVDDGFNQWRGVL